MYVIRVIVILLWPGSSLFFCGFLVFWSALSALLCFITEFVILCVALLSFIDEVNAPCANRIYVYGLGPRVKLAGRKSALNSPVVYSTDRSKAVVPVLVLYRES